MQGNKRSIRSFRFRLIFFLSLYCERRPSTHHQIYCISYVYAGVSALLLLHESDANWLHRIGIPEPDWRIYAEKFALVMTWKCQPKRICKNDARCQCACGEYTWMCSQFVSWIIYALYDFIIGPLALNWYLHRFNWNRIYSDLCVCIDFKLKSSQSWSASVSVLESTCGNYQVHAVRLACIKKRQKCNMQS